MTDAQPRHIASIALLSLFIGLAGGSVDSDSGAKKIANEAAAFTTTADQLYSEYDANQVSADTKYKGKIVVITGPISDIGKDVTDTAYVIIGGTGLLNGAQCMFPKGQESLLGSLSKGQQVSAKGEVSGKIGNVLLRNCTVQ
ncbi:MAG: hypothetical protein NTZ40_02960 [Cyanobacteria bacterium]|nr:hypothetical protein [Cyanobacteriota bacterium]